MGIIVFDIIIAILDFMCSVINFSVGNYLMGCLTFIFGVILICLALGLYDLRKK